MPRPAALPMRSATIDAAKGIAIVLVVYGHCLRGLTVAGLIDDRSWLQVTDYVIYSFHMPLFFFVSGLFVRASMARGAMHFWRGKVLTILYPYVLWSLLQGSVQIALAGSGVTNRTLPLSALFEIFWAPISPFWFLYALFFALLAAYLTRLSRPELLMGLALAAFLATLSANPQILNDIAYGTFYLALGMVASERGWIALADRAKKTATASSVFLFAVIVSACYVANLPERLTIPAAFSGIAATIMLCALLCRRLPAVASLLGLLGQASMAIYVMHILALGFVRFILAKVAGVTDAAFLLMACTAAGVIIPVLAQVVLSRMQIARVFGLPPVMIMGATARA